MAIFDKIKPERAAISIYEIAKALRDGKATLRDVLHLRRDNENAYVTHISETVSTTKNIHLRNPSSNDKDIDVHKFTINSHFEGNYKIYDRFDSLSGGTSLNIDNLRMDTDGDVDDGTMESNKNVTFTASTTPHFEAAIPGGGAGGQTGGNGKGTEPIIEPGREIVVQIENTGNDGTGSVGIVYSET